MDEAAILREANAGLIRVLDRDRLAREDEPPC